MNPVPAHGCSTCPRMGVTRRGFLGAMGAAGASALAVKTGLLDFAASLGAAETPAAPRCRVVAAFLRPKHEKNWMGWPGAAYDLAGHLARYTDILTKAAEKQGVHLEMPAEPLYDAAAVNALLERLKAAPPDGVILTNMDMPRWKDVNQFVESRGPVPTVLFSPMGTSFTGHLKPSSLAPGVFLGATQDAEWLATAVRMHKARWAMRRTRLVFAAGSKTEDKVLEPVGTTLHYVPRERFVEELQKVQQADEAKALAAYYAKEAKKVVEPSPDDVLNAAENYLACRSLMAAENCQGISMDCLGLVGSRKIPCPPCIGFSKLLDEGRVGCCEGDVGSAISLLLTAHLLEHPGFMQDPAPNTVNNTLMGAHCTCPTRLDGLDKPPEPFILRSHSESSIGVSPQVLWRIGQKATVMKLEGGGKSMILGTGRVVANIDTPPSGGCRTSVELAMDGVADCRDVKGFHQLFLYGDHSVLLRGYGQLAGIQVGPIA